MRTLCHLGQLVPQTLEIDQRLEQRRDLYVRLRDDDDDEVAMDVLAQREDVIEPDQPQESTESSSSTVAAEGEDDRPLPTDGEAPQPADSIPEKLSSPPERLAEKRRREEDE